MSETVFFDQSGVTVTNSRFIVSGQTYAMNGVTSIKHTMTPPPRIPPIVLGLIGVFTLLGAQGAGKLVGVVFLGLAIFWWLKQRAEHFVILNSSSGETRALSNKDKVFITSVVQALNQSIIHRG